MDEMQLTPDLGSWFVTLRSGERVDIAAHAAKDRQDFLVFVALMKGEPNYEIALAAFPRSAVADWGGGDPFDGTFERVGPLTLL